MKNVKIHIVDNYRQLSIEAAGIVADQLNLKNNSVLGLATGSTPEGMYGQLVQMNRKGVLDFSSVITFNLDEYLGLAPEHPQSYHYYMYKHFLNHINIPPQNVHILSGIEKEIEKACSEYDQKINEVGGIDLQVLGIGVNGHIGFNEPHPHLKVGTHLMELTEETIKANSRFFSSPEAVPRQALTMGMGAIMQSRRILLLASGESKASAIRATLSGRITTEVPASLLQLHRELILILDKEAASFLD
jgi:glucosamine-6-phosphate deaminase